MPLIWNWHIDAICDHLQAVTQGHIRHLLINVPPGHAKSLLVCVMWPAWEWTRQPERRSLFSSYAGELSVRDSVRCRGLIESPEYQQAFAEPNGWSLSSDQNVKSRFENTRKGSRMALSVGGKAIGFRGDVVVCDDPIGGSDVHSKAKRESAIQWWDQTMSSRVNDPAKGAFVVIMQRLHQDDLAGHLIERGGYEHLCLPSEFDSARRAVTSLGIADPRSGDGKLLFPALFPKKVLDDTKTVLGTAGYSGQHQQDPVPAEGNMFKRGWWRYWRRPGAPPREGSTAVLLPEAFDEVIQSWDLSFKDTSTSDWVVGGVWGRKGPNKYLLYRLRERLNFPETLRAFRRVTALPHLPRARKKLIEAKANGPAIIDTAKAEISGIVGVEPLGSKEARAAAVSPQVEAGNVYLPEDATWLDEYIEEHANFPLGKHDDQVDMTSQALLALEHSEGRRLQAMARSW